MANAEQYFDGLIQLTRRPGPLMSLLSDLRSWRTR
jgi:hypothetical protein